GIAQRQRTGRLNRWGDIRDHASGTKADSPAATNDHEITKRRFARERHIARGHLTAHRQIGRGHVYGSSPAYLNAGRRMAAVSGTSRGADAGCLYGLNTQHDPLRASGLAWRTRTDVHNFEARSRPKGRRHAREAGGGVFMRGGGEGGVLVVREQKSRPKPPPPRGRRGTAT